MKCPNCKDDIKKHISFGCVQWKNDPNGFTHHCDCATSIDELIDLLQAERDEAVELLKEASGFVGFMASQLDAEDTEEKLDERIQAFLAKVV